MDRGSFLRYVMEHPSRFNVVHDKDDVLTHSAAHWARLLCMEFDLDINADGITSVPELYALLPTDERRAKISAWLDVSFQTEAHYHNLPLITDVTEAMVRIRAAGADSVGCLTARREILRSITEPVVHSQLGKVPVIMRPNDMQWDDTYAWKAEILSEVWPWVQGIVEDNPRIIPALEKQGYQGTVWLYRSAPPKTSTIRVVSCANHAAVAESIAAQVELLKRI